MGRVRLTVAYDGTGYHGWQLQDNGITIESELNRCLSELLGEPVRVIGASRTDAGVHALGNIAVFDTKSRIPPEKISYALNQRLPEDIRTEVRGGCPGLASKALCKPQNLRIPHLSRGISHAGEAPVLVFSVLQAGPGADEGGGGFSGGGA